MIYCVVHNIETVIFFFIFLINSSEIWLNFANFVLSTLLLEQIANSYFTFESGKNQYFDYSFTFESGKNQYFDYSFTFESGKKPNLWPDMIIILRHKNVFIFQIDLYYIIGKLDTES